VLHKVDHSRDAPCVVARNFQLIPLVIENLPFVLRSRTRNFELSKAGRRSTEADGNYAIGTGWRSLLISIMY
jgi:hypothetical protein